MSENINQKELKSFNQKAWPMIAAALLTFSFIIGYSASKNTHEPLSRALSAGVFGPLLISLFYIIPKANRTLCHYLKSVSFFSAMMIISGLVNLQNPSNSDKSTLFNQPEKNTDQPASQKNSLSDNVSATGTTTNQDAFENVNIEAVLKDSADTLNRRLPKNMSPELRLEKVTASGLTLTNHYTFTTVKLGEVDIPSTYKSLNDAFLDEVCNGQLRNLISKGVTIKRTYNDNMGSLLMEIVATSKDC